MKNQQLNTSLSQEKEIQITLKWLLFLPLSATSVGGELAPWLFVFVPKAYPVVDFRVNSLLL